MKLPVLLLFGTFFLLALVDPSIAWLRKGYPSTKPANAYLNAEYFSDVTSLPSPLFLTPYIEANKLDEGRKLSAVKNLPGGAPNTDTQRKHVRAKDGKCIVWGRPPKLIRAKYLDDKGEERPSVLLASGFWGIACHLNYLFESMTYLAMVMPTLSWLPFAPFVMLLGLLVHRTSRDGIFTSGKKVIGN